MKSGNLTQWSMGEYDVKLVRQDETEGGLVLHFVVAKPVVQKKGGLLHGGFIGGGEEKSLRKNAEAKTQGGSTYAGLPEGGDKQEPSDSALYIRYSRIDPITHEVVVGIYVQNLLDKGTSIDTYNQHLEKLFYRAAESAVEESKRLGLT